MQSSGCESISRHCPHPVWIKKLVCRMKLNRNEVEREERELREREREREKGDGGRRETMKTEKGGRES